MTDEEHSGPAALAARGPLTFANAMAYFRRAAALTCPVCGEHPIFSEVRRVRSLHDWLTPLEGCPRCRYRYEREPGYFLLATWAVNYLFVGGLAILTWLLLSLWTDLSLAPMLLVLLLPMPVFSVLFARHAKALWLALDHFLDPHRRARLRVETPRARR